MRERVARLPFGLGFFILLIFFLDAVSPLASNKSLPSSRRVDPELVQLLQNKDDAKTEPFSVGRSGLDPSQEPATPSKPKNLRVVSYNILSSSLASPSYFTKCTVENLDSSRRLPKVLRKLQDELTDNEEDGGTSSTVFLLQEVSHEWSGYLHTFFANRNYNMIDGSYGKKFNGYMGIAIAYSMDDFETLEVVKSRLSDHREEGWPRMIDNRKNRIMEKVRTNFPWRSIGALFGGKGRKLDHWKISEERKNVLLFARLRPKLGLFGDDDDVHPNVCIANYHMPCAFYAPMVMTIHADLLVKRVQVLSDGDPHILGGDFNILPDSSTYNLITTGKLDEDDETYPTSKFGMKWCPTIRPMRSAYAQSDTGEPDFTNFSQIKNDDPFIGTLDYIFISDLWNILGVKKTGSRLEANGPLPNDSDPSDHIVIAATLEIPPPSAEPGTID